MCFSYYIQIGAHSPWAWLYLQSQILNCYFKSFKIDTIFIHISRLVQYMCIVCNDQIKGVSISLSSSIYHIHILK